MILWHEFLRVTGSSNVSGTWYGFWSGFAGDLPLFGVFWVMFRKHNCHHKGCPRITWRQHDDGSQYCRRHHPDG